MSTPKDKERIAAFRAWYRWAERQPEPIDIDLNPRTVERMLRGSRKAPPPKLLEELAAKCRDRDIELAKRLIIAAAPHLIGITLESDGRAITGISVDLFPEPTNA
jgi:hypothetical protein